MKNLFNPTDTQEILSRIERLTPEAQRRWGKMEVAQMLAHCAALLSIARGLDNPKRSWLGVLLGWAVKGKFFGPSPHPKNSPTGSGLVVTDKKHFEEEKKKLIVHIQAFAEGGPEACTRHPNPFFGKLTPEEWAQGQYKHLDHHLQQFGV